MVSEPPKLAEYQAYIDFEMKEGDPARVQIIFERALAENCLVPDLWIKYTMYLVSNSHKHICFHQQPSAQLTNWMIHTCANPTPPSVYSGAY